MKAITVHKPSAVDLITYKDSGKRSFPIYQAEIRSADVPYTLALTSSQNEKVAQKAAGEVNDFLLASDAPSLHKRFPVM
ncbi:MAG: hypothetical protein AAFW75_25505 [Cyanobacteria bacterium J06636_16]